MNDRRPSSLDDRLDRAIDAAGSPVVEDAFAPTRTDRLWTRMDALLRATGGPDAATDAARPAFRRRWPSVALRRLAAAGGGGRWRPGHRWPSPA